MADLILHQDQEISLFESIKRFDEQGQECWYARELMPLLGYQKWQRFEDAIKRATMSCENANISKALHFKHLPGSVTSSGRQGDNYKLSRYACHLIGMNGDPRKKEIAAAQRYFSAKIWQAEQIIPVQNDRIRELELELRLLEKKESLITLHGKDLALRLMGDKEAVVYQETVITELVEPATGRTTKILTADQLKKAVKERTGQRIPSMKSFTDALRKAGRDDLLVPVTCSQTSEHVPPDRLEEAIAIVFGKQRQRLIGE